MVILVEKGHEKDTDWIPMLAIKGAPADHDPQTCCLCSTLCYVLI